MIKVNGKTYIDVPALSRRGWTESLVRKFLGPSEMDVAVDHWLNPWPKRSYSLSRVERIEDEQDFKEAFSRSVRRRKLTADAVNWFYMERKIARLRVKVYVDSLTEKDVRYLYLSKGADSVYLS
jgi:hypothetical protein